MAITRLTGFEHQVQSSTVFAGAQSFFDNVSNGAAMQSIIDSALGTGKALRVNKVGTGSSFLLWNYTGTTASVRFSFYFNGSLPAAHVGSMILLAVGAGSQFFVGWRQDTGKLRLTLGSVTDEFGPVLVADTLYTVQLSMDIGSNPRTMVATVVGDADTGSVGNAETGSTFTNVRLGSSHTADVFDAVYDNWVLSDSSADYPIPGDGIDMLLPNADGTHAVGSGGFANSGGGTSNYFAEVDAWPDGATFIEQQLNDGAAYVELVNQSLGTGKEPIAVQAVAALRSDGSAANAAACQVNRGDGAQAQTVYSGDMSETASRYVSLLLSPPGGGVWDRTKINNRHWRVGFGTDTNPDPEWRALGLEVLYLQETTAELEQAVENDTAGSLVHSREIAIGRAVESDTAPDLIPGHRVELGRAVEADTAGLLATSRSVGLELALETDSAALILVEGGIFRDLVIVLGRPESRWAIAAAPSRMAAAAGRSRIDVKEPSR